MLEIILAVFVIAAITQVARGRGASAWLAGTIATAGFVCSHVLPPFLFQDTSVILLTSIGTGWAWLLGLMWFYRTRVGKRRPQPTGMWVCPGCTFTNQAHDLACQACKQPWTQPNAG